MNLSAVHVAELIAREAHSNQKRLGGEPFVVHPQAVAKAFPEAHTDARTVAWLHDVVEDNENWTHERLEKYGFSNRVLNSVYAITKQHDEDYAEYLDRLVKDKLAYRVKLEDVEHNLKTCPAKNKTLRTKFVLVRAYLQTIGELIHGE